ncbi:hypothetical protein [Bacillus sp. JCM 19034]|nr:hypothetical protein [Bacillus sp. JCM 19034]
MTQSSIVTPANFHDSQVFHELFVQLKEIMMKVQEVVIDIG